MRASVFVELELGTGERRRQDVVDGLRQAMFLAQDLGVIDLLDLDARTAGGGPQPADAAVGTHVVGSAGQEEQQGAPGIGAGTGIDRERADEMTMEQGAHLDH